MKNLYLAVLQLAAVACSTLPPEQRIASESDVAVCQCYGFRNNPLAGTRVRDLCRAEIEKRSLIPPSQWSLVAERSIQIGMTRCAMYAAWGVPDHENRTVTAHGEHIQHVYGRRSYVYTDNGKVTAFQQ